MSKSFPPRMGFITVLIIGLGFFRGAWTQDTGSPVCSSKLHCCDGGGSGRPTENQGLIPGCSNLTSLLGGENPISIHQATCKSSTHQVCCGGSKLKDIDVDADVDVDVDLGVDVDADVSINKKSTDAMTIERDGIINPKNIPSNIRKLLVAILKRGNCDKPATSDDLATLAEHGYKASCCRDVDGHRICCGNATGCRSTCKSADSAGIIPCSYPKCATIRCKADCDLAEGLLN